MRRFLLSILSLLPGLALQAQPFLNLPSLLSDNMVLQADSNVTLWGWADPGVTVRISTSWGEKIDVKTDYSTRFSARLKTPAATFDPQSLTFSITRGGRT
ncbi:MAG: sialate O-acetylesterase, partial [Candidatus Cryptobacteroides sp.]